MNSRARSESRDLNRNGNHTSPYLKPLVAAKTRASTPNITSKPSSAIKAESNEIKRNQRESLYHQPQLITSVSKPVTSKVRRHSTHIEGKPTTATAKARIEKHGTHGSQSESLEQLGIDVRSIRTNPSKAAAAAKKSDYDQLAQFRRDRLRILINQSTGSIIPDIITIAPNPNVIQSKPPLPGKKVEKVNQISVSQQTDKKTRKSQKEKVPKSAPISNVNVTIELMKNKNLAVAGGMGDIPIESKPKHVELKPEMCTKSILKTSKKTCDDRSGFYKIKLKNRVILSDEDLYEYPVAATQRSSHNGSHRSNVSSNNQKKVHFHEPVEVHLVPYESRGSSEWQHNLIASREMWLQRFLSDPRLGLIPDTLRIKHNSTVGFDPIIGLPAAPQQSSRHRRNL